MILDKPNQFSLVGEVSAKVEPHALRSVVFQAVVKALVVAVVEPQLLQLPLQIPVGFSNKTEIRAAFSDAGYSPRPEGGVYR